MMPPLQAANLLKHIRSLANARQPNAEVDNALLARFIAGNDEAAFAEIVRRHGAMVLGVCRSILQHQQDAEDVFQATFLVLARRAGAIRKQASLGSWLHGVAHRLAHKSREQLAKRHARTQPASDAMATEPIDDISVREWQAILHDEMQRLPDKYRAVLLLCYWEGKTRDEAAEQLGLTRGTLKENLERARNLLRSRLARRGLAPASALFTALFTQQSTQAVSAVLVQTTAQSALAFATGKSLLAGSAAAGVLAHGALSALRLSNGVVGVIAVLVLSVFVAGGGWLYVASGLGHEKDCIGEAGKKADAAIPTTRDDAKSNRSGIDTPKDTTRPTVRDFDFLELQAGKLNPFDIKLPRRNVKEPIELRSSIELAKLLPDDERYQQMIQERVDFAKERLLFFHWSGSGQDRLWFELSKPNEVRIRYSGGKTADDQPHYRLFVIANDAAWKIEDASRNEHPPVRELQFHGGYKGPSLFHDNPEPLLIDSLAAASKAFPDPNWLKNLAGEVDFAKQRLLYFNWEGSGQDDVSAILALSPTRKTVQFKYHPGAITNLVTFSRLYVVNRDVEFAGTTLWSRGSSFSGVTELPIEADQCTTPAGDFAGPITIRNEAELLHRLGSEKVVAEIRRAFAIDFNRQHLLLFCWNAKVGTEIAHAVHAEWNGVNRWEPKSKVVFYQSRVGLAALAKRHLHLYTIPKDAQWTVLSPGDRPFDEGKPVFLKKSSLARQIGPRGFSQNLGPFAVTTSAQAMAKAFPDKTERNLIASRIDFETERLVSITWAGGAESSMSFAVDVSATQPIVVFQRHRGGAKNLQINTWHFAVANEAGVRVEGDPEPAADTLPIRKLNMAGIFPVSPDNAFGPPVKIVDKDNLGPFSVKSSWREAILSQVDLNKEYLLFFHWSGSGSDKLSYKVNSVMTRGKPHSEIAFHYEPSEDKTEGVHDFLFAIARDSTYTVSGFASVQATPALREIALDGLKSKRKDARTPTSINIANVAELNSAYADQPAAWIAGIARQVDFTTEKLLYLDWGGSSGDRVESSLLFSKNGPIAFFRYFAGEDSDLRPHHKLFAVPKNATWKIAQSTNRAAARKPAVRELVGNFTLDTGDADPAKATRITNAQELARRFTDMPTRNHIAHQVDFEAEHLLYFAWVGNGDQTLKFDLQSERSVPTVVFQHRYRKGDDRNRYGRLFAIPFHAEWRLESRLLTAEELKK